jgi:hypothetical protein
MDAVSGNLHSAKNIYAQLNRAAKKNKDGLAITEDGRFLLICQRKDGRIAKGMFNMERIKRVPTKAKTLVDKLATMSDEKNFDSFKNDLQRIFGQSTLPIYEAVEYGTSLASTKHQANENLINWIEAQSLESQLGAMELGGQSSNPWEKFIKQDRSWQKRYLDNPVIDNSAKKELFCDLVTNNCSETLPVFKNFFKNFTNEDEGWNWSKATLVAILTEKLASESDMQRIQSSVGAAITMIVKSMSVEERTDALQTLSENLAVLQRVKEGCEKELKNQLSNSPANDASIQAIENNLAHTVRGIRSASFGISTMLLLMQKPRA